MLHDDEGIAVCTKDFGHQLTGADKCGGDDGGRRNTKPFGNDRVVHTARRAAASVADSRDQRVPAFGVTE